MKKFRVLLLTLVVAVAMMAGSLSVFAVQGVETDASTTVPNITKAVTIAEGVTMPATDFVFTATLEANADQVDTPTGAPESFTTTASKAEGSVTNTANSFTVAVDIPEVVTTTVGEYTYKITETAPTATTGASGWTTVSEKEYYLHVYVKNDGSVLYSVTEANTAGAAKVADGDFKFENEYQNNEGELTVSKAVTNPEYVPADTEYEFKLTFTTNGSAIAPTSVTGTKGTGDDAEAITVTNEGTFKLKNGQSVTFSDLPVGVQYQVVETAPTHASYKETSIVVDGANVSGLDTGAKNITETANSAAYTNVYDEVTITGVIMNVLPFVMMIVIGGAAAALYVASRRRRAAR